MLGCYVCGEIDGEYYESELGDLKCSNCHNKSMVNFRTAIDILVELNQKKRLPSRLEEYLYGQQFEI